MVATHGIPVVLAGVVACAALSDVRTRRIPNRLTASALAVGLVLRAVLGLSPLLDGVLGAALALVVVLPLFALRGIGGGDAKLLIVVGAFLGPKGFVVAALVAALAGGVMSLAAVARRGVVLPALLGVGDQLRWFASFGRRGARTTLLTPGVVSVPYGVAIAVGSLAALYLAHPS
jgi:prepilin peptidase CpaA